MKGCGGGQTQTLQNLSGGTVPSKGNGINAWKEVHLSLLVQHLGEFVWKANLPLSDGFEEQPRSPEQEQMKQHRLSL